MWGGGCRTWTTIKSLFLKNWSTKKSELNDESV